MASVPAQIKQVVVAKHAKGMVQPDVLEINTVPLDPELQDGDVLVKVIYISLDPYIRGRLGGPGSAVGVGSPLEVGCVVPNYAAGQVVASRRPGFQPGDYVEGPMAWAEYHVARGGAPLHVVQVDKCCPLSYYIGLLGMPGLTAYFGLLDVGQPKAGETVYVSAASGAVGQVVGQLAKIAGCRVVGSAGSGAKVAYLQDECGYDAAFNYKEAGDLVAALRRHCPAGIDVYFENVGGPHLQAVLELMAVWGCIPACGMISQYNREPDQRQGVSNLFHVVVKRLRMQGFLATDYEPQRERFLSDMTRWLREGRLQYREDIAHGIEATPAAFCALFTGDNFGKAMVQLCADPSKQ